MLKKTIKKRSLFCVSVRENYKNSGYLDVLVIAKNIREARRIGVDACEKLGLIKREFIKNTLVYKHESEVYHA